MTCTIAAAARRARADARATRLDAAGRGRRLQRLALDGAGRAAWLWRDDARRARSRRARDARVCARRRRACAVRVAGRGRGCAVGVSRSCRRRRVAARARAMRHVARRRRRRAARGRAIAPSVASRRNSTVARWRRRCGRAQSHERRAEPRDESPPDPEAVCRGRDGDWRRAGGPRIAALAMEAPWRRADAAAAARGRDERRRRRTRGAADAPRTAGPRRGVDGRPRHRRLPLRRGTAVAARPSPAPPPRRAREARRRRSRAAANATAPPRRGGARSRGAAPPPATARTATLTAGTPTIGGDRPTRSAAFARGSRRVAVRAVSTARCAPRATATTNGARRAAAARPPPRAADGAPAARATPRRRR